MCPDVKDFKVHLAEFQLVLLLLLPAGKKLKKQQF